jgi:hypothetical protein
VDDRGADFGGGMRLALGITLLTATVIYWLITGFEWLVLRTEPNEQQRESMKRYWLLWHAGIVRKIER